MKIKNIYNKAFLKVWLVLFALIPFSQLTKGETWSVTGSESGKTVNPESLKLINSLKITANKNDFPKYEKDNVTYNGIEKSKYYNNGEWFGSVSSERPIKEDSGTEYFTWGPKYSFVFKLEKGSYIIKLNYKSSDSQRGIWAYPGTSWLDNNEYNSELGKSIIGQTSGYEDKTLEIEVTKEYECWCIGGIEGSVNLHSIEIEKEIETAPRLEAVTAPYFWYYNGGGGFGPGAFDYSGERITNYGNNGDFYHYRYLTHNNWIGASSNGDDKENYYVYVNGNIVGGNNSGGSTENRYGSYALDKNDAIGFKLDGDRDYRVKVYLLNRDGYGSNGVEKNNVLYRGVNVDNLKPVNGYSTTIINSGPNSPTSTRLITYEISGGGTYWIRNIESDLLYIGGFEVLPKNYPDISNVFKGEDWYVGSNNREVNTALSSTQTVNYAVDGGNVVVWGPAMALNVTQVNGRSVMLNNGNKIGVYLPAGAKLSFKIAADEGTNIVVTDEKGTTLVTGEGSNGYSDVVYPAAEGTYTKSAQKIWITGETEKYVYISGFKVDVNKIVYDALQIINEDYIYKVNDVPEAGILNGEDGRIKFVGTAVDAPDLTVLGLKNDAVAIDKDQDFFGFKVGTYTNAEGKQIKTGHIKIYFNGGNSDSHKMEELPLVNDYDLGAGWNSSYNGETHTVNFTTGGGRGWWYGDNNPKDISAYNKVDIELEDIQVGELKYNDEGKTSQVELVIHSTGGVDLRIPLDQNGRLLGEIPAKYTQEDGKVFDPESISQIYIGCGTAGTLKIKSARMMNKPVVIATGTNENNTATGYSEVFGGIIHDVQDAHVYDYPFDLSKTSDPQLYWVTGDDINLAAIEVIYDEEVKHARVVEWYVNKDTKMIVGSDDPKWKWSGFSEEEAIEYPEGFDEYVTFYMSGGRQANVSFIMPEAVREVYDWEIASDKTNSYGRHTIEPKVEYYSKTGKSTGFPFDDKVIKYGRKDQSDDKKSIKSGTELYSWYTAECDVPSNLDHDNVKDKQYYVGISFTATQKENGEDKGIETVKNKTGQWKIYMRFISYPAPVFGSDVKIEKVNEMDQATGANKVTVTKYDGAGSVYYTLDSSEPENLGVMGNEDKQHSSTEEGTSANVTGMNCIFKAAQYLNAPYQFYNDCINRDEKDVTNSLKLVSKSLAVVNEKSTVVYVKDDNTSNGQLFDQQQGGFMLTIPTGDDIANSSPHDQKFNKTPYMYLTLGGKDWRYLTVNGDSFGICGTDWKAGKDGGLFTYLDSYRFNFGSTLLDGTDGASKQDPYTECNGGVGGAQTEKGGMFLQPIAGTMLRFEPEYDGVITVWLRQNGAVDHNTQELGTITRRPTFVMDENGRVMTRSTVRPTAAHYLGIDGVYAINSSVAEERNPVEHTWLYAVAKQVFENHPVYDYRFNDASEFPNRWETDKIDHGGHIMYGWWYKGFNLDATRSAINSASHVSRYEYMEPELLYRSDKVYEMEMETLGLNDGFARYGFELPNFQYVRYRIPVKAGKTYYIAGRGTKNGLAAISFDRVKANTNGNATDIEALRCKDNPDVGENPDNLKVKLNWTAADKRNANKSGVHSETDIDKSYADLDKDENMVKLSQDKSDNWEKIQACNEFGIHGLGDNLVGKTVNFYLDREFTAGYWHPIILPFSLSETRVEQYFGEGTVVLYLDPYKHTLHNATDPDNNRTWVSSIHPALENSKLSFTRHRYQMLYANTPAFICPTFTWTSGSKKSPATDNVRPTPDNGKVKGITFKRVTIDGSNMQNHLGSGYFGYAISSDYEVVGTYDQRNETGDVYYINNNNNSNGSAQLIHSSDKTINMRGTRVWIRPKQTAVNPAPIRTVGAKDFTELDFDFGNDEAGINDIVNDDITVERYAGDSGVYDLLGRKIAEDSLEGVPAGVYIFNGRKVYVN